MRCSSCDFENPLDIKFCGECGAPLKNVCSNCGFGNPPRFKFCGECATPLKDKTPPSKSTHINKQPFNQEDIEAKVIPILSEPKATEAERRQLTVMFCDLVGSTSLSEQLDPEDLRDVICSYQESCAEVIDQYDGYIAQYLGDGLLVYFGYPQAHEDDAHRAVTTGLEILTKIQHLNERLLQPVQIRIGIHTGLVVAGEMGGGKKRDPMAIVGETPNIAARLQALAESNTIIISAATYRLVEGLFDFKNLGTRLLKGISTPVDVYQVLNESDLHSRFEFAVRKGLIPLIGREREVELLLERWERVKEGEGQVVLLSGEAGIGKSRLVQMLKEHVAAERHTRIESRCSPYYENSAFYPIIDNLQRVLDLRKEDSSKEKVDKLEKTLEQYGFSLQEMAPLFASLLSLPLPESYPPLIHTPQGQKQKTMEALLAWLLKEAEKNPVLRIVEDLHWVDPSTLEYLSLLLEQVPMARIFALLTFRSDFRPPWSMRSHLTHMTLNRLARKQVEVMVERIAGSKCLPAEVVQQIVSKTDGVPLFVEELTKMVIESGLLRVENGHSDVTAPLPKLAIPSTLQDSLMARLDRLSPINSSGTVKEVAQLAATLGREFTYELLKTVSPLNDETLRRELAQLVEAELLYQRGIPPDARYFFKHTLIQESAYQSLLKSKRREYHRKIAEVLELRFPDTVETRPELRAHHYTEGGLMERAVPLWLKAGQRAVERSANVEAISHLTQGLAALNTLPETSERSQQELNLQITLSVPLTVTRGYGTPDVGTVFTRARELCHQTGETAKLVPVLRGLAQFYRVKGELKTARELAEELLTAAQNLQNPSFLLEGHLALGEILFWLGDLSMALDHVKKGFALYNPQEHRSHAFVYVQDPGMACCGYAAWTMSLMGYSVKAIRKTHDAMTIAKERAHPYSLAIAHVFYSFIHQFRRESNLTKGHADKLIEISSEQGFSQWLAVGKIMRGWAVIDQGLEGEGIEDMMGGIAERRARGSKVALTYFLALLADAYNKLGNTEQAITVLAEAIDTAHKNGELFYQAELYRLKGEQLLDLSSDNRPEAQSSFRKAIDIASHQGAKSFELRAVTSLSRLLSEQGGKDEARKMLAEIYGWFTEGFDTKDLKDANALLEELS